MNIDTIKRMIAMYEDQGDTAKVEEYLNKLVAAEAEAQAEAEESDSSALAVEFISFGEIDEELMTEYTPYTANSNIVDIVGVKIAGESARFRAEFSLSQLFPEGEEKWRQIGEISGDNVRCRIIFAASREELPAESWQTLTEFQAELDGVKATLKDRLEETGLEGDELSAAYDEAVKEVFPNTLRFRPPTGGINGVGFRSLRLTGLFQIELNTIVRDGQESRPFWLATNSAYDPADLHISYGTRAVLNNLPRKRSSSKVNTTPEAEVDKTEGTLPQKQNKGRN